MEPTIHSDDILLTEHITPWMGQIRHGDIIIAKCPSNPKQQICKRVIGLPGETVKVGFASYKSVPRGHVWLQGDNNSNSLDSRSYGPIPQGLIKSRAICKVWPIKSVSMLVS